MSGEKVDVIKRYHREIHDIEHKLMQLQNGNYYENTGAKMDGYLANNIGQLRKMIGELLLKIENGDDSIDDMLSDLFK
jgi:signal transduction histidine kinase